MDEDDRAEKPPRSALPIDMEHSEYLQESDASDGACRKDLTIAAKREDD